MQTILLNIVSWLPRQYNVTLRPHSDSEEKKENDCKKERRAGTEGNGGTLEEGRRQKLMLLLLHKKQSRSIAGSSIDSNLGRFEVSVSR